MIYAFLSTFICSFDKYMSAYYVLWTSFTIHGKMLQYVLAANLPCTMIAIKWKEFKAGKT